MSVFSAILECIHVCTKMGVLLHALCILKLFIDREFLMPMSVFLDHLECVHTKMGVLCMRYVQLNVAHGLIFEVLTGALSIHRSRVSRLYVNMKGLFQNNIAQSARLGGDP